MKRHAIAKPRAHALVHRPRRHGAIKVRKNFVFLLPFAVPILLGGVSIAALVSLKSKAAAMVSLPAVAGAGVGYIAAKAYKQDVKTQVAAAALGYVGGLMITHYTEKKKEEAEQAKHDAEFSYLKPWTWFAA